MVAMMVTATSRETYVTNLLLSQRPIVSGGSSWIISRDHAHGLSTVQAVSKANVTIKSPIRGPRLWATRTVWLLEDMTMSRTRLTRHIYKEQQSQCIRVTCIRRTHLAQQCGIGGHHAAKEKPLRHHAQPAEHTSVGHRTFVKRCRQYGRAGEERADG